MRITKEDLLEVLKTQDADAAAKFFGVRKPVIFARIKKYSLFEDSFFVNLGIKTGHQVSLYYKTKNWLEQNPERYQNFTFLTLVDTVHPTTGVNLTMSEFKCNVCDSTFTRPLGHLQQYAGARLTCYKCHDTLLKQNKKHCPGCNEVLFLNAFHFKEDAVAKVTPRCKNCVKLSWKEQCISKKIISHYYCVRNRSKRRGIPFDITPEDIGIEVERLIGKNGRLMLIPIKWPTHCPVLGIKLLWNTGEKKRKSAHNSPSFDRIIPELGYIKGNVQIVSNIYNVMKNNSTSEQRKKVAEYWINGKA